MVKAPGASDCVACEKGRATREYRIDDVSGIIGFSVLETVT